ncbi:MAG: uracil-DNA glycosylase family protein [Nitrospina sp.]|jgi:uracil-DNA glycosylase|nr:uracil-DNA glycosylase family protein [Nitrospina sp.]
MSRAFKTLIKEIKDCRLCEEHLDPRPVVQAHAQASILIAGQAPGRKVHETGIPFNDPSGIRLRNWMGIDENIFYDAKKIALLPMGFCYPGTGTSGDLPPRPECAEAWREKLLSRLPKIRLTLVIGQYAQKYHLGGQQKKSLTETVRAWRDYWKDGLIPLPHPSPRNNIWLRKNAWFEEEVLPTLKSKIQTLVKEGS